MKKVINILIFCSFYYHTQAQDTLNFYLNSRSEITKHQSSASFQRKAYQKNNLWYVIDYYLNGTLKMTGSYTDSKFINKQGVFNNFYSSGKIKSIEIYNNNKKNGKWIQYYENGKKDFEIEYLNDSKTGEWHWYFENGQIGAKEKYDKNNIIKAKYWNQNGQKVEKDSAEYAPSFEGGGFDNFKSWVAERAIYPQEFSRSQIKGEVRVKFTVNEKGEIEDIKLTKNLYSRIDDVVYNVIKMAPKWKPGKMHNREFPYQYELGVYMEYKN
jgi:TonB family protein